MEMPSAHQIKVGGVAIGGGAPIVVQSMTLTKTHDVEATTAQIAALASAGCEIVRVAVPKLEDAKALPLIVRLSPIHEAPRYGRPQIAATAMRRPGASEPSAARAASAVSAGIASRRPLKASTSDDPVASAAITATACGPTG